MKKLRVRDSRSSSAFEVLKQNFESKIFCGQNIIFYGQYVIMKIENF